MNRAIEKDLFILVPNLTSTGLPSELVQLANSLLSQSRSKASALKPEEEIARSFCCAHIACERLKIKLDLPDIQVRPPCSKKVYGKLFRFLDATLAARTTTRPGSSATPSTPSKRKRGGEALGTPSRVAIREKAATPRQTQPSSTPLKTNETPSKPPSHAGVARHVAEPDTQSMDLSEPDFTYLAIEPTIERSRNSGRLRGGEMLNCAVDWLSDERKREYKIWKDKMMRLIKEKLDE